MCLYVCVYMLCRMMLVPIVFRKEIGDSGQLTVFGHPQVVYVASVLTGAQLYSAIEGVVSCLGGNFTLFLTGGQVSLSTCSAYA
jgi:hypothetical protein